MLHDYEIEVDNSKQLKDNTMLNCSMELSLLNDLFRENLTTEAEHIEITGYSRNQVFAFQRYIDLFLK